MTSDLRLLPLLETLEKGSPLQNKLARSYREIVKWAKHFGTDCFRLFDRDISTIPLAIEYYAGRFSVHYFARTKDDLEPPAQLQEDLETSLKNLFGVADDAIFWRTRVRKKETRQYEKAGSTDEYFEVHEGKARFWVNLINYLDSGLFLDHRETRKIVAANSKGKRVLNLFAYTAAFSVQAALAGAAFTKSVDLSNTYCDWAKQNFILNKIPLATHQIVRADCIQFLYDELRSSSRYDLIVIDPPTISRSKKMQALFDIQKDYLFLIEKGLKLLNRGGVIYFSTNSRKFIFDSTLFPGCTIEEISAKTKPIDFSDPKIHRCWIIKR